jgi:CheY-like chemotaxis protein
MILKGKNIFIVEDDLGNRATMLTMLQLNGASTNFDHWGRQTMQRLKNAGKVDLILMDLMLSPGVTGYDVFDQLQADPELCQVPVVMVSASDPDLEMNRARHKGFQGFITKPLNYATFAQTIAAILNGKQVWADE